MWGCGFAWRKQTGETMARKQAREPQEEEEGCDLFKALVLVSLGEPRETLKGL
jgi:hypothetical protein